MIKILIGGKGSGKTKTLIDLTNNAAENSKGSVICIERATSSLTRLHTKQDLLTATTTL